MKFVCPYRSFDSPGVTGMGVTGMGVTVNTNFDTYNVNNLDYKVYKVSDASDILINTVNGLTKNNNNDTLSNFYNYQIIKIPYDEFSFDNNTTTTYKIVPSSNLDTFLEGETNPPTLKVYLAGGCFSNPITNSIVWSSYGIWDSLKYFVTQNFPSATASIHIGTVKPLLSGLILNFNKNEVKLNYNNNTYIALGNVKSDGKVYSYGTIQNAFNTINRTWDNSNWPNGATIISSKPQSRTFTTTFEKYIGYKINATKENKNEVKIVGDFKFTFNRNENQINETKLIQNGVDSPEVRSLEQNSTSKSSTVTPTKPYAVFHTIIPYSFINMFPYFYNKTNSNANIGVSNIIINNIHNNGLILYVPTLSHFTERTEYRMYREKFKDQFVNGVITRVNIKFNGRGIVTVATTSKNNDVIMDNNRYAYNGNADGINYYYQPEYTYSYAYNIPDDRGTLYRNGKNTGKYATKILVDNSIISIKMIDFSHTSNSKDKDISDSWYQPRLYVDEVSHLQL